MFRGFWERFVKWLKYFWWRKLIKYFFYDDERWCWVFSVWIDYFYGNINILRVKCCKKWSLNDERKFEN